MRPPASAGEIAACESALGCVLPESYQEFLRYTNGAVLWHTGDLHNSGLHLLGTAPLDDSLPDLTLQSLTLMYRQMGFEEVLRHMAICGRTPGAGGFYLTLAPTGAVVDMFGSPFTPPIHTSEFPPYAGQWRIIAPDVGTLVTRIMQKPRHEFFWF